MAKPNHQPSDVLRVRTIALILSVTVAKVWPGAMTGQRGARGFSSWRHSSSGFSSVMAAR